MSKFQLKKKTYAKCQEDLKLNERRQSIDDNAEMTVTLESSDKYCKVAVIKILQWTIINTASLAMKTESASKKKKKKISVRNRKYKKFIILALKTQ